MPSEIERKFLLASEDWRQSIRRSNPIRQGYLAEGNASVRVRVSGDEANLNIKSMTLGVSRLEYEYTIPLDEAHEMLDRLCRRPLIEKTRHLVEFDGRTWEIDEFTGDNAGLVVAELELGSEDEAYERPDWLGVEVSDDPRYYNVRLVQHPYRDWPDRVS
ncbi:MAG: CYTH domain-containing protein [Pseudomonadota bacterium]